MSKRDDWPQLVVDVAEIGMDLNWPKQMVKALLNSLMREPHILQSNQEWDAEDWLYYLGGGIYQCPRGIGEGYYRILRRDFNPQQRQSVAQLESIEIAANNSGGITMRVNKLDGNGEPFRETKSFPSNSRVVKHLDVEILRKFKWAQKHSTSG